MRLWIGCFLALIGCSKPDPVAPVAPRARAVEPTYAAYDESSFRMPDAPKPPSWGVITTCEGRQERLSRLEKELEESKSADLGRRCELTVKHKHDSLRGESWGPERAWICDGQMVDSVRESARTMELTSRVWDLRKWVATHCVKG